MIIHTSNLRSRSYQKDVEVGGCDGITHGRDAAACLTAVLSPALRLLRLVQALRCDSTLALRNPRTGALTASCLQAFLHDPPHGQVNSTPKVCMIGFYPVNSSRVYSTCLPWIPRTRLWEWNDAALPHAGGRATADLKYMYSNNTTSSYHWMQF
jgi:hypothetical protein